MGIDRIPNKARLTNKIMKVKQNPKRINKAKFNFLRNKVIKKQAKAKEKFPMN